MFTRSLRERSSGVVETLRKGHTFHSPFFSARVRSDGCTRVSCVVSKKVATTAVARNALKRRMRHAVKKKNLPRASIIFFAKKGATTLSYYNMEEEIEMLVQKIQQFA